MSKIKRKTKTQSRSLDERGRKRRATLSAALTVGTSLLGALAPIGEQVFKSPAKVARAATRAAGEGEEETEVAEEEGEGTLEVNTPTQGEGHEEDNQAGDEAETETQNLTLESPRDETAFFENLEEPQTPATETAEEKGIGGEIHERAETEEPAVTETSSSAPQSPEEPLETRPLVTRTETPSPVEDSVTPRAGDTFTDEAGITHAYQNGEWVAQAGQEKPSESDGFIYLSDGEGGWSIKDGQQKTEDGATYMSRGGEWVLSEPEISSVASGLTAPASLPNLVVNVTPSASSPTLPTTPAAVNVVTPPSPAPARSETVTIPDSAGGNLTYNFAYNPTGEIVLTVGGETINTGARTAAELNNFWQRNYNIGYRPLTPQEAQASTAILDAWRNLNQGNFNPEQALIINPTSSREVYRDNFGNSAAYIEELGGRVYRSADGRLFFEHSDGAYEELTDSSLTKLSPNTRNQISNLLATAAPTGNIVINPRGAVYTYSLLEELGTRARGAVQAPVRVSVTPGAYHPTQDLPQGYLEAVGNYVLDTVKTPDGKTSYTFHAVLPSGEKVSQTFFGAEDLSNFLSQNWQSPENFSALPLAARAIFAAAVDAAAKVPGLAGSIVAALPAANTNHRIVGENPNTGFLNEFGINPNLLSSPDEARTWAARFPGAQIVEQRPTTLPGYQVQWDSNDPRRIFALKLPDNAVVTISDLRSNARTNEGGALSLANVPSNVLRYFNPAPAVETGTATRLASALPTTHAIVSDTLELGWFSNSQYSWQIDGNRMVFQLHDPQTKEYATGQWRADFVNALDGEIYSAVLDFKLPDPSTPSLLVPQAILEVKIDQTSQSRNFGEIPGNFYVKRVVRLKDGREFNVHSQGQITILSSYPENAKPTWYEIESPQNGAQIVPNRDIEIKGWVAYDPLYPPSGFNYSVDGQWPGVMGFSPLLDERPDLAARFPGMKVRNFSLSSHPGSNLEGVHTLGLKFQHYYREQNEQVRGNEITFRILPAILIPVLQSITVGGSEVSEVTAGDAVEFRGENLGSSAVFYRDEAGIDYSSVRQLEVSANGRIARLYTTNEMVGNFYVLVENASGTRSNLLPLTIKPSAAAPPIRAISEGAFTMEADEIFTRANYNSNYATRVFQQMIGDQADFILLVPSRGVQEKFDNKYDSTGAYLWFAKPDIRGVFRYLASPRDRLQGLAQVQSPKGGQIGYEVIHELGHRWGLYWDLPYREINDRAGPHWGEMYSDASVMSYSALEWTDNQDGTFSARYNSMEEKEEFNDLDLYAMGLIPPSEVRPTFAIRDARRVAGEEYKVTGKRLNVRVEDIIRLNGTRTPGPENSQKDFKVAFLYIKMPGEETEAVERNIASASRQLAGKWSRATRGLSTMNLLSATSLRRMSEPELDALKQEAESFVYDQTPEVTELLSHEREEHERAPMSLSEIMAGLEEASSEELEINRLSAAVAQSVNVLDISPLLAKAANAEEPLTTEEIDALAAYFETNNEFFDQMPDVISPRSVLISLVLGVTNSNPARGERAGGYIFSGSNWLKEMGPAGQALIASLVAASQSSILAPSLPGTVLYLVSPESLANIAVTVGGNGGLEGAVNLGGEPARISVLAGRIFNDKGEDITSLIGNAAQVIQAFTASLNAASSPVLSAVQGFDQASNEYTDNEHVAAGAFLILYGSFSANNSNTVKIDGQSVAISGQTQRQINVQLNSDISAGRHTVSVSNPGGVSSELAFTVISSPSGSQISVIRLSTDKIVIVFDAAGQAKYTTTFTGEGLTDQTVFDVKGTDQNGDEFEILNWQTGSRQEHVLSAKDTKPGIWTVSEVRAHANQGSGEYTTLAFPLRILIQTGLPESALGGFESLGLSLTGRGEMTRALLLDDVRINNDGTAVYGNNSLSNVSVKRNGSETVAMTAAIPKGETAIINAPLVASMVLRDSSGAKYVVNYFSNSLTSNELKAVLVYEGKVITVEPQLVPSPDSPFRQQPSSKSTQTLDNNNSWAAFSELPESLLEQIVNNMPPLFRHSEGYPGWPAILQQGHLSVFVERDGSLTGLGPWGSVSNARIIIDEQGVMRFMEGRETSTNSIYKYQRSGNGWVTYWEGNGWDGSHNWVLQKEARFYDDKSTLIFQIRNPQMIFTGNGEIVSARGIDVNGNPVDITVGPVDPTRAGGPYTFIPISSPSNWGDRWAVLLDGQVVTTVGDSGREAFEYANDNHLTDFYTTQFINGNTMASWPGADGIQRHEFFNSSGQITSGSPIILGQASSLNPSAETQAVSNLLNAVLPENYLMYDEKMDAFLVGPGGATKFIRELERISGNSSFSNDYAGVYVRYESLITYVNGAKLQDPNDWKDSVYIRYLITAGYLDINAYDQSRLELTDKARNGLLIGEVGSGAVQGALEHETRHRSFFTDPTFRNNVINTFQNLTPYQQLLGMMLLHDRGYYYVSLDPTETGGYSGYLSLITELDAYTNVQKEMDVTKFNATNFPDFVSSMQYIFESIKSYLRAGGEIDEIRFKLGVVGNAALLQFGNSIYFIQLNNGSISFDKASGSFMVYRTGFFNARGEQWVGSTLDYYQNGIAFQITKQSDGQWALTAAAMGSIVMEDYLNLVQRDGQTLGVMGKDSRGNMAFIPQNGLTSITTENNVGRATIATLKDISDNIIAQWEIINHKYDKDGNLIATRGYLLNREGQRTGDTIVVPFGNYAGQWDFFRNNRTGEMITTLKDEKGRTIFIIDDRAVHIPYNIMAPLGWIVDASRRGPVDDLWNPKIPRGGMSYFDQQWLAVAGGMHDFYGGGW